MIVMVRKKTKRLYHVFGKRPNETFGEFYTFLSTSKQGAEQQARKKYNLKVLETHRISKIKTP